MIIVKLYGGLGNQMFQYAAGRSLSLKLGLPLAYEGEYFRHPERFGSHWSYQLGLTGADCAEWRSSWPRDYFNQYYKVIRKLNNLNLYKSKKFFFETPFTFDQRFLDINQSCFIDGYFQSEKYFQGIRQQLIKEFSPKVPFQNKNMEIADLIRSTNSVSLHVRRGDYIHNPAAAQVHGSCTIDFYRQAISFFESKVRSPYFFIFSDDLNWVRSNIEIKGHAIFVDNNVGKDSYIDMHLMSLCRHNITANSSFSWWGAWLNSNQEKITIAPKQWYKDNSQGEDEICPASWVRI